jgi:hypothetical protein
VLVVGGTYRELCARPSRDEMFGSGLRAAAAVAALDPDVELVSAIDADSKLAASIVAHEHGVRTRFVSRNEPVEFSYFTPLSSPSISGRLARLAEPIEAVTDSALVFGMVEAGSINVKADRLVFDPQRPRELTSLELEGLIADRTAIILNRVEASAVTGGMAPPEAARSISELYRAEVVVVKRGAQGAVVYHEGKVTEVGVFPTLSVFPIGSGDAFAAGFAWAWMVKNVEPVLAARIGSLSAAIWCGTETLPLPPSVADLQTDLVELPPKEVQVYLAGPFFTVAEEWLIQLARDAIRATGSKVFSPLHDIGRHGDDIASRDLDGLRSSDSVLAMLDGADTGTWFEVGWARREGKPVVAYCDPTAKKELVMAQGTGVEVVSDLPTAVYRSIWAGQR